MALDEYLFEFFSNNVVNKEDDLKFHDFRAQISEHEQRLLFSEEEVHHLKSQLKTTSDEFISLLDLPDRIYQICNVSKKVENNLKIGVPLDTGIAKILISKPVMSKDKNFVIFAINVGHKNAMYGAIKWYKKGNDGYTYYALLDSVIE